MGLKQKMKNETTLIQCSPSMNTYFLDDKYIFNLQKNDVKYAFNVTKRTGSLIVF